jgi:glycosyltransferase involved in cell wall biosynthesis
MDAIVVLSNFMKSELYRIHGEIGKKIVKIPAGVDTSVFNTGYSIDEVRRNLGLPERVPIVFAVRRLVERMGLQNLIVAMKQVVRGEPSALLLIGGDGPLMPQLSQLIEAQGLGRTVKLLGFVEPSILPRYYQACDVAILPTEHLEGFGLVLLESLSTNTPILGTPVGAIPEVLSDFDSSLLLEGSAPSDLAGGILDALARSDKRTRKLEYREHVLRKYTWDIVSHEYLKLFKNLLKSNTV